MTREEAIKAKTDGDTISRQAAIDECDKQYPNIDRQDFKAVINAVPSAEPKTGHWIFNPKDAIESMFTLPKCSECGFESSDAGNFCSNCGAKMKGGNTE